MKRLANKLLRLLRFCREWPHYKEGMKNPLSPGNLGPIKKMTLSAGRGGVMPATRPPRPPLPPGQGAQSSRPDSIPSRMLLCTTTGEMVHIRYIESINFKQDADEEIMGKLADEQVIKIRTISGKDYEVSIREMIELDSNERTVEQMVKAIHGCFQRQE